MDNQEPEEEQVEPTSGEHDDGQEAQEAASTLPWERDGVDLTLLKRGILFRTCVLITPKSKKRTIVINRS